MITLDTPWVSEAPIDPAIARARLRGGKYTDVQVEQFIASLRHWCAVTGMAEAALCAQVCHETSNFRFGGQVKPEQFNFAGIGSTNDGAAGHSFASIDAGVGALLAHHGNYRYGTFANWPEEWRGFRSLAIRNVEVNALRIDGKKIAGTVRKIGDFVNGVWAFTKSVPLGSLANGYAAAIVKTANELLQKGEASMQYTQFPSPNFGYPRGDHGRNGHKIRAIVLHISDGTIGSMRDWFANPASQASSNVGMPRVGLPADQYVQFSDSPWTNGDVDQYDRSIGWLVETVEAEINVNEVTETIESEGKPFESWPEAQYQGLLAVVKERLAANGLTASKQTVIGHFQINGRTRPNCPGPNFPWSRLYHDLAVTPNIGPKTLSMILSDTYENSRVALAAAGLPDAFGLKLYEATIDLTSIAPTLPKVAQALICEKSVIWVGNAGAPDIFHRGQYEALPASAKKEWK